MVNMTLGASDYDDWSIRHLEDLRRKKLDDAYRFTIAAKKLLGNGLTDDEVIARIEQLLEREKVYKDFYE